MHDAWPVLARLQRCLGDSRSKFFLQHLAEPQSFNLVVVRATDVAGNVALTTRTLPSTLRCQRRVLFNIARQLERGRGRQRQQFTATDDQGRPRTDATWTVSNTAVATITTTACPCSLGVASGSVTLTAPCKVFPRKCKSPFLPRLWPVGQLSGPRHY